MILFRHKAGRVAVWIALLAVFVWLAVCAADLLQFGDWVLYGVAAAGLVFIATYWISAKWWKSKEGRNIMALSMCIVAVVLLNSTARFFGSDYPGREWIRIAVYACLLIVVIRRIQWLVRAQILKKRER